MHEQVDLFSASYEKPILPKHIRLIELFAGIGAQAKALDILGCDFEHWLTCEWSWHSITAYNAIHMGGEIADTSTLSYEEVIEKIRGVSNDYNKPMTGEQLRRKGEEWARQLLGRMIVNRNVCPDVSKLTAKDLDIRDKENNAYVLTYSFPCQDLSNAGLMKGMDKESGTRSGLIWQVERILLECQALGSLPQVLLLENVPAVCSKKNAKPWSEWMGVLTAMGYTNYVSILNAKDFGIPQNRLRCFMISILGEYSYSFPRKQALRYRLKDFINKSVDESYYLSVDLVKTLRKWSARNQVRGNGFRFEPTDGGGIGKSIVTKPDRGTGDYIDDDLRDLCNTENGYMMEEKKKRLRIRKLTEGECMRLMGFAEADTIAMREAGLSKANIYHSAGDSIVTTVLVALMGSLIGLDYAVKIQEWSERLSEETLQKRSDLTPMACNRGQSQKSQYDD